MHFNLNKSAMVYLAIIIAMLFWSLSFIWYKDAYIYFGPMATVFLRLVISGVLLLLISWITGNLKIEKKHIKLFLLAALFEPFLYFMSESIGMKLVSSVTAAVVVSTIPILSPIITSFFYPEKLSVLNIFGIILSFIGVGLVILNGSFHLEASVPGVILMFVAVFAAIGYAMALKKLTPHYKPLTIVAIQNTIGAFMFAPFFLIFDLNSFVHIFNSEAMLPVFNLAIFSSSIAFIMFAYGVSYIGVTKANIFTNLIPVITSVLAYFLLNERFTSLKILGIVIVVSGLFLSQINITIYRKVLNFILLRKNTKI
jgi:drug/metabolite transporter (DMT)-like permease